MTNSTITDEHIILRFSTDSYSWYSHLAQDETDPQILKESMAKVEKLEQARLL